MPTEDVAGSAWSVAVGENVDELPLGEAGEAENSSFELSADNLDRLLGQALETSTREVDDLIGELETLREKLRTDASRIRQDILAYAEMSRYVMKLTTIISEGLGKVPSAPNIAPR